MEIVPIWLTGTFSYGSEGEASGTGSGGNVVVVGAAVVVVVAEVDGGASTGFSGAALASSPRVRTAAVPVHAATSVRAATRKIHRRFVTDRAPPAPRRPSRPPRDAA